MATAPFLWYGNGAKAVVNKEIDWDSDTVVTTLHSASYVPNRDTHGYVSDLTNELATGGGYTQGGFTITNRSRAYTPANSWATTRANSTAYAVGQVVRPASANGYLYRCSGAGTSGGSVPTYPTTVGLSVSDGTVTWTCVGTGAVQLTGDASVWHTFTATGARYAVLSDRTAGTAATQPLLAVADFGSALDGQGGDYTVAPDSSGYLLLFVP